MSPPLAIAGFGTFQAYERPARKGRDPRTRKEIDIKARWMARYRPATGLLETLQAALGNEGNKPGARAATAAAAHRIAPTTSRRAVRN